MRLEYPVVREILSRAMVARIATVSRNGRPHVNPLYSLCGNGKIYLGTTDRTLAALNVKANPRATVLFNIESDPDDLRVLRIRGGAMVRIDSRLNRWYLLRDLRKYFGTRRGLGNTIAPARLLPTVVASSCRVKRESRACSRSNRRTRNY